MEHPSGDPEVVDISLLGADNQHESGGLFPQNALSEEDTQMATIFPSEKKEKNQQNHWIEFDDKINDLPKCFLYYLLEI